MKHNVGRRPGPDVCRQCDCRIRRVLGQRARL